LPQVSVALQLLAAVYLLAHVPAVVVSPKEFTVVPKPHESEAVGAVKVGEAGHSMVALLGLLSVTVHVQLCAGLSATKMAAQSLFLLIVADPAPVEPAAALKFHAPPIPCVMVVYDWVRAPGDVAVANELSKESLRVAANIRTAALAVTVLIEVTPVIVLPVPVV